MQKVQILFPDPVLKRLRRIARASDRPVSELVRRAVDDYLVKSPEVRPADFRPKVPVFHGGKIKIGSRAMKEPVYRERRDGPRGMSE